MPGKRYAIIVGVSDYSSVDGAANLQYTVNDAIRLHQILTRYGGFAEDSMYLFCDGPLDSDERGQPPHRSDILGAIRNVCEQATEDDLVLFYFAGHGVELQNTPYLLTNDTRMNVVAETALPVIQINEWLQSSKAGCVLRIFDACRAAYGGERLVSTRAMSAALDKALMTAAKGWATLSACSSGEFSREDSDLKQGVFSFYLCEGLSGRAAGADGTVNLERLSAFAKDSVAAWCDKQGLRQTPHSQMDMSGVLRLTCVQPEQQATPPANHLPSPLASLGEAIARHLSQVPEDVKGMRFTDKEQHAKVGELWLAAFRACMNEPIHPAIAPTVEQPRVMRQLPGVQEVVNQMIHSEGLQPELVELPTTCRAVLSSSTLTVPTTSLTIVVARFSFCYGLYFVHRCIVPQLQQNWKPDPPYRAGRFVFAPSAALEPDKADLTMKEMLSRCGESVMQWTGQLTDYMNRRLAPVRKIGDMVR